MISNTVIAQIMGGTVVTLGVTGGAGVYAYKSNLFEKVVGYSKEKYIIAKSVAHSEVTDIGELYKEQVSQYKCELTTPKITDENCDLVELQNDEKNLSSIFNASTKTDVAKLRTASKYFKIIVSSDLFEKVDVSSDSKDMQILQKFDKDRKIFGKLKLLYKVENGKVIQGKTNVFLSQLIHSDSSFELFASTQYTCTIETRVSSCHIFEFTKEQPNSKDNIDLSEVKQITTKDKFIKDHYFVIEFTSNYKQNAFNKKDVIVDVKKSADTAVNKFKIIYPYSVLSSDDTFTDESDKSKFLILE